MFKKNWRGVVVKVKPVSCPYLTDFLSFLKCNHMVTITWRTDLIFLLWFTVIRSWHWWGRWRRTLKPKQEKKLSLVERKYFQLVIIIIKCHVKCKIIMFPFNYKKCKHSSLFCVPNPGGTLVTFWWLCTTGLWEHIPHYSLFCGQL